MGHFEVLSSSVNYNPHFKFKNDKYSKKLHDCICTKRPIIEFIVSNTGSKLINLPLDVDLINILATWNDFLFNSNMCQFKQLIKKHPKIFALEVEISMDGLDPIKDVRLICMLKLKNILLLHEYGLLHTKVPVSNFDYHFCYSYFKNFPNRELHKTIPFEIAILYILSVFNFWSLFVDTMKLRTVNTNLPIHILHFSAYEETPFLKYIRDHSLEGILSVTDIGNNLLEIVKLPVVIR